MAIPPQMVFSVLGKRYSLPAQSIIEVKGSVSSTPLPESPDFVKGVTYFRGKLIPVISLKLKWGGHCSNSDGYCLIVKAEGSVIALEVDLVDGISKEQVQSEISPLNLSDLFL